MRLRRSDVRAPGWTRRGVGRGWAFSDEDGALIRDGRRARIQGLAVPPAWRDVWICPWPHGHIQATGTDAAGRRQYRYHDAWRVQRDAAKHERVLVAGVRLLDLGAFRVGSDQYTEDNGTYGLATLRRDHVQVHGRTVAFCYLAKGGKQREITVTDAATATVVAQLLDRPADAGEELLAWQNPDGSWRDVHSDDVNVYLREVSGAGITAKDFRTWTATVLMAVLLGEQPLPRSASGRTRAVRAAYRSVADQLGNTPAVCRASYVDPRVVDRFEHGETIADALVEAAGATDDRERQRTVEAAVCRMLSA